MDKANVLIIYISYLLIFSSIQTYEREVKIYGVFRETKSSELFRDIKVGSINGVVK